MMGHGPKVQLLTCRPAEQECAVEVLHSSGDKPPQHPRWISQARRSACTQCESMALNLRRGE